MIPLPASYERRARQNTHPGLALDKFVDYGNVTTIEQFGNLKGERFSEAVQRPTVATVAAMASPFSATAFDNLRQRRDAMLAALGSKVSRALTAGPFTLHLARASALENAGLCLHPIYGFAYLPGTGLKGLARAYALTEDGRRETDPDVLKVFGNSAGDKNSHAGAIVFHDAWPTAWPELVEDILNTHHKDYYSASETSVPPPGDWEEPSMVNFLAVAAGTTFDFPLSNRRGGFDPRLLETAQRWLLGGLTVLGPGAKTAAGYGHFVPDQDCADLLPAANAESYTLELDSPAFLAGANQKPIDCELRPATLRGLLRWWWRTLHAGFVDAATMRRLESAIWGSTKIGGAVRFTVQAVGGTQPIPYERSTIVSLNKLPSPANNKTTQGLTYHSYGMDESKGRRSFIPPKANWKLHLQTHASYYLSLDQKGRPKERDPKIPFASIASQAKAALWLLCRYGGVGAKNRKGFGSLALPKGLEGFNLEKCKQIAAEFRENCGLKNTTFNPARARSPSWEQALVLEIPSGLANPWLALDLVASSAQAFAQSYKHRREKMALGLPRRIGDPAIGVFNRGVHVKTRHSSPVHYHLILVNGSYTVGVTAFPASELPDLAQSRKFLGQLLTHLQVDLPTRFAAAKQFDGPPRNATTSRSVTAPRDPLLTANSLVQTVIVPDPKGKGRIYARVEGTDFVGNVINAADMPAELRVIDSKIQLKIANVNLTTKNIGFNYLKPRI